MRQSQVTVRGFIEGMEGAFKIFAPLLMLQLGRFRLHFFEVCLGKSHLIILKLQSVFLNSFNVICSS